MAPLGCKLFRLKKQSMGGGFIFFGVLLFLLEPSEAFANTPFPSLFGFGAPFYFSIKTFGGLFLGIIFLEGIVLRYGLRLSWSRVMGVCLLSNFASSLYGVFIALDPSLGFAALLLSMWGVSRCCREHWKYGVKLSQVLTLAPLGLTIPCVIPWSLYRSRGNRSVFWKYLI